MDKKTFDEKIRLLAEQFKKEQKELHSFFESEEFNKLFDIIQRHNRIEQEDLRYGTCKIEGLTAEDFGKVLESVFHNLNAHVIREMHGSFPEEYVDYKGIRFHLMMGQGSSYWSTKEYK